MSKSRTMPLGTLPQVVLALLAEWGIDSAVTQLSILNPPDSRAYQTPDNTVRHIPELADYARQAVHSSSDIWTAR